MNNIYIHVYTDVDNRETAGARKKNKGDEFCWKKNMKIVIAAVRKWEMLAAIKMKMSGSEKTQEHIRHWLHKTCNWAGIENWIKCVILRVRMPCVCPYAYALIKTKLLSGERLKNNRSNKKRAALHLQHTFLYIFLLLFRTTSTQVRLDNSRGDELVRRITRTSSMHYTFKYTSSPSFHKNHVNIDSAEILLLGHHIKKNILQSHL